jgi:O-antigen/teichoic acid export membrane protein
MVYFLPLFIQHLTDTEWIKRKTKDIYFFVGAISSIIGAIMYVFAPLIVRILWGEKYLDAVPCMRVLSVSFFFLSTFRITSTNILLALKKAGYTLVVSIITGVTNIILDVLMTIRFGSIGAAYATLIVTFLASLLSFPYVLYVVYSGKKAYY